MSDALHSRRWAEVADSTLPRIARALEQIAKTLDNMAKQREIESNGTRAMDSSVRLGTSEVGRNAK